MAKQVILFLTLLITIDYPEHASNKLNNTLTCILDWCIAHEFSIESAKSEVINFSKCCDTVAPQHLYGLDIAWKSLLKILGICFTHSLFFMPHIRDVKMINLKED